MPKYTAFNPAASAAQHMSYWSVRSRECGKAGVQHISHSIQAADSETEKLRGEFTVILKQLRATGKLSGAGLALDFGCGWGRWTHLLGAMTGSALGVDISSTYIDAAQPRDRVSFHLLTDPLMALPLERDSVELIFTCTVLQHLVRAELFDHTISEFKRVLAPGGTLFLFECMDGVLVDKSHIAFRSFEEYASRLNWATCRKQLELTIKGEKHVLALGHKES